MFGSRQNNYLYKIRWLWKEDILPLREKCPYSELFWSVFYRIRTTQNTDTFYAVFSLYKFNPIKLSATKKWETMTIFNWILQNLIQMHANYSSFLFPLEDSVAGKESNSKIKWSSGHLKLVKGVHIDIQT